MTDQAVSLFDNDAPAPDLATGQPAGSTLPVPVDWPAPPDEAAYHGLPGAIVAKIAPNTEADPVAILAQLLVACGALIGRGAHFQIEATRHHPHEFVVLVGESAKARKGSSFDHVAKLMTEADPSFPGRLTTGLSSGEGLIWTLLDATNKIRPEHLNAALALWDYAARSAAWAINLSTGDPLAEQIHTALARSPDGLTRTQIRDLLHRNHPAERVDQALQTLTHAGRATRHQTPTAGRPAETWTATQPGA
jgi:hypothetical protein